MSTSSMRQRKVVSLDKNSSSLEPQQEELSPFTPPNFTIKDMLDAIPKHCFERSALKSSAYLLMDFVMIAALGVGAYHIDSLFGQEGSLLSGNAGVAAKWVSWAAYWWYQGLVMTGVWVIAHECGHQAYSTSKTVNNTVGWFLHSALLVPYHSWRISHAKHHAATGHMTRDQVFVPKSASQIGVQMPERAISSQSFLERADDLLDDSPIYVFLYVVAQQLFGWPAYMIRNASGQKSYPKYSNHFNPNSVIFEPRHYGQIIISDIGLALAFAALYYWAQATSFSTVIKYYGVPYLFVNHWLVLITFLQHTDPVLPHYRAAEWNFQRGALCTQDRNVHNFFTHSIANTHVLHHTKSSIPHYHAAEATDALKKLLGPHYLFSNEHWLVSLFRVYRACRFVPDEGDVIFYHNAKGQAVRKVVYESEDSGVELQ